MLLLRYNTCMRHQETVAEEDAHNSVFPGWQALGRQKQFTFTTDIIDIYNLASSRHYTLLMSTVCDGYYLVLQAIHTVLYTYNLTCPSDLRYNNTWEIYRCHGLSCSWLETFTFWAPNQTESHHLSNHLLWNISLRRYR